jgi:hypothetical protein
MGFADVDAESQRTQVHLRTEFAFEGFLRSVFGKVSDKIDFLDKFLVAVHKTAL